MRQSDGGREFLSRVARGRDFVAGLAQRSTKPARARRSTRSSPAMRSRSTARSERTADRRTPDGRDRARGGDAGRASSSFSTSRRPRSARERSQQLRSYIHAQAAKGVAFIFISHKLFEIVDVANAVAVLRNGKLVWHGDADEVRVPDLVRMMGGEAAALPETLRAERRESQAAAVRRSHQRRRRRRRSATTSSCARAKSSASPGLEGSGQKELLHRIFAPGGDSNASVERNGAASFVSGDRLREGVFPLWSVLANIGLGRIADLPMFRLLSRRRRARAPSRRPPSALRLDVDRLKSDILELSGGNQQKALVARALVADAPIILLDDPTRGVDVAAKRDFYHLIAEIAALGPADRLAFDRGHRVPRMRPRAGLCATGGSSRSCAATRSPNRAIVDASFRGRQRARRWPAPVAEARRVWARALVDAAPFLSLAAGAGGDGGQQPQDRLGVRARSAALGGRARRAGGARADVRRRRQRDRSRRRRLRRADQRRQRDAARRCAGHRRAVALVGALLGLCARLAR